MAAEGGEAKKITISIGQKFAGWPLDFPAADRNRLAAPKTPISIATPLTVHDKFWRYMALLSDTVGKDE